MLVPAAKRILWWAINHICFASATLVGIYTCMNPGPDSPLADSSSIAGPSPCCLSLWVSVPAHGKQWSCTHHQKVLLRTGSSTSCRAATYQPGFIFSPTDQVWLKQGLVQPLQTPHCLLACQDQASCFRKLPIQKAVVERDFHSCIHFLKFLWDLNNILRYLERCFYIEVFIEDYTGWGFQKGLARIFRKA